MGIKGFVVSVLALSSIVSNVAGLAIQTTAALPRASVIPRAGPLTGRASPQPQELVGVSRSTLGDSTNDPTLQKSEAWYWGHQSDYPIAKVSWAPKSDNTRVFALDAISDWVKEVDCYTNQLTISLKDKSSYQKTKDAWKWLDAGSQRDFVMIVENGNCGPHRLPYVVTGIDWNDGANSAHLTAKYTDWFTACPEYHLEMDTTGIAPANSALAKRFTISHDFSIPVAHDFSQTLFSEQFDGVTFEVDCADCQTQGQFDFKMDVVPFADLHLEGTVSMNPSGLALSLGLGLKVSAAIQGPISKTFSPGPIALGVGVSIAGLGTVGPVIDFGVTASLDSFDGFASVSMGATMSISDSAQATVDFTNSANNQFSNFGPSFSPIGPSIDAGVSASGSIAPFLSLGLDFEVTIPIIGTKFGASAGVALIAPELDLNFAASASSGGGACGNADADFGVEFDVGLQGTLNVFAGLEPIDQLPNKFSILGTSTQLFSTCITVAQSGSTPPPATTPVDTTPAAFVNFNVQLFSNTCCGGANNGGTCDTSGLQTTSSPTTLVSDGKLCSPISPGGADGGGVQSLTTSANGNPCTIHFFSDNVCSQSAGDVQFTGAQCITASQIGGNAGIANFATITCP